MTKEKHRQHRQFTRTVRFHTVQIFLNNYLLFTDIIVPGDQKGLFKLAVQLGKFYISVIYNTATGYVLLVYLTNI
jgi:hypothetical protein